MYYQKFYDWCRTATAKIAYPPDRSDVYAELYDHMMERYESFKVQGFAENDAAEKTVAAMGDPSELAPQLAAIHKPHWAYAMILTRVALIVLLAVSLVRFAFFLNDQHYIRLNGEHMLYDPFSEQQGSRLFYVLPEGETTADGYTFCVEKAAAWKDRAVVRVKVRNIRPWALESAALKYMWVRDSKGNAYVCHAEAGRKTDHAVFVDSEQVGLSAYDCNLYLYGDMEDVKWFELCYNRAGRTIRLWVDLTGGNGYE